MFYGRKQFSGRGEIRSLLKSIINWVQKKEALSAIRLFRRSVSDYTPQKKGDGNWRDLLESAGSEYYNFLMVSSHFN